MRYKFDSKELEIVGTYNVDYPHAPQLTKYNTPITPKENYLRMFKGEKPLWMPAHTDNQYFGPNCLPDVIARGPSGSFNAEPVDLDHVGGPDMFGVEWVYVPAVNGSMPKPGVNLVPDLEHWEDYITFPDVNSWDWAGDAERNKAFIHQGLATSFVIHNGLFERLVAITNNMENVLMALIDEDQKPAVHRFFNRLCDLYEDIICNAKKWFDIDIIWFHDDWGSQINSLFSLDTCREMIMPYLKRVADCAHKNGLYIEFHSCGRNENLVPAMIEAGIDAWRGQPVINDKKMLFEKYGDKIILGIEPTKLPADTEDMAQLEKDCREFVERYAVSGRVYCSMFKMPPKARDLIYEMSRKLYAGE